MNELFLFSQKQYRMMEFFWEAGRPLARADLLEHAQRLGLSWKPATVRILLGSLLEKGALETAGYRLRFPRPGRTFRPAYPRQYYTRRCYEQAARLAAREGAAPEQPAPVQKLCGRKK